MRDVNILDLLIPEAGAICVMDRGYLDFERLYVLHQSGAFFVTRAKSNLGAHRIYSTPTDRTTGIICDQTIALNGYYSRQHYPDHLGRIRFKDAEGAKTLNFLGNQFALPATTICALYKARWQVELFFKWVKSRHWWPNPKVQRVNGPVICRIALIRHCRQRTRMDYQSPSDCPRTTWSSIVLRTG